MDPELASAIGKVIAASDRSTSAAERAEHAAREATTAANAAHSAANATTDAIHTLTREQQILRRDFLILWRAIYGPNVQPPPPPPPGVDPSTDVTTYSQPPLAAVVHGANDRATSATGELAELSGRLMAVQADQSAIRAELVAQSSWMGLGKKGWAYLFSPAGQKNAFRTIGAAGALVAAIGVVAGSCRAPAAPVAPPPAPTMIILSPPSPSHTGDAQP